MIQLIEFFSRLNAPFFFFFFFWGHVKFSDGHCLQSHDHHMTNSMTSGLGVSFSGCFVYHLIQLRHPAFSSSIFFFFFFSSTFSLLLQHFISSSYQLNFRLLFCFQIWSAVPLGSRTAGLPPR